MSARVCQAHGPMQHRTDGRGWRCRTCEADHKARQRGSKRRGPRRERDTGTLDYCHSCNSFFRSDYQSGAPFCVPCDRKWAAVRARHNALNDRSDDLLGIATDIRRAYERLEIASGAKRRPDFWSGV